MFVDVHQLINYGEGIPAASTGLSTYINCCMHMHNNTKASLGLSTYSFILMLGFVFVDF